MEDFLEAVKEARQEYLDDYRPELERLAKERDAKRETSKKEQLAKLMKDMKVGSKSSSQNTKTTRNAARSTEDLSKHIDEEYEGDGQIIEPVSVIVVISSSSRLLSRTNAYRASHHRSRHESRRGSLGNRTAKWMFLFRGASATLSSAKAKAKAKHELQG